MDKKESSGSVAWNKLQCSSRVTSDIANDAHIRPHLRGNQKSHIRQLGSSLRASVHWRLEDARSAFLCPLKVSPTTSKRYLMPAESLSPELVSGPKTLIQRCPIFVCWTALHAGAFTLPPALRPFLDCQSLCQCYQLLSHFHFLPSTFSGNAPH